MIPLIKKIIRSILPDFFLSALLKSYRFLKIQRAKRAFAAAKSEPQWLSADKLEAMQRCFPLQTDYGYSAEATSNRGNARARTILDKIAGYGLTCESFLELACGDGMVCARLNQAGKKATGVDLNLKNLAQNSRQSGAQFQQMDVEQLALADNSLDCVYSFNGFEHFADPEKVLREATRLTKPGGIIYLDFGPLYYSPTGLHAYRSISVPYCQLLFPMDLLLEHVSRNNLRPISNENLNRYSIEQFRNLWIKSKSELTTLDYNERIDISYLDLIREYPSCFKSKTSHFDDLIICAIEIVLQKK